MICNNPLNQSKLWSKTYILMLVVSLLVSTGHYMLMSTVPLYAKGMSGSNSVAGMMVSVFTFSALIFRPVFGNLMDNRGRKVVLVSGAIILMVVAFFYNLAFTVIILLILRFFNGMGFSAHTTASGTIVSDVVPSSRLSEGIGYYGISNTIATAIGPMFGLFLIEYSGYRLLFILVFILAILSFISTLFVNYENRDKKQTIEEMKKEKESFIEKTSVLPSLIMFFISLGFGAIITFLPAYGISRGIDDIGVFFTFYACAVMLTRMFIGKLADRHGFMIVLIPGLVSLFISLVILAFATSLQVVLVAGVLFGLGFGTAYPLTNAIVIKLCSAKRRGAANATIFAAMDIGIGLGAVIWGVVSEYKGFTIVFLASAICVFLSFLVYITLVHTRIPNHRNDYTLKTTNLT